MSVMRIITEKWAQFLALTGITVILGGAVWIAFDFIAFGTTPMAPLLLLSLAANPYSRAADAALISLRLTLLIVLSILVVRERWRNRHEPSGKSVPAGSDVGDHFLQRFRRWYRGE